MTTKKLGVLGVCLLISTVTAIGCIRWVPPDGMTRDQASLVELECEAQAATIASIYSSQTRLYHAAEARRKCLLARGFKDKLPFEK